MHKNQSYLPSRTIATPRACNSNSTPRESELSHASIKHQASTPDTDTTSILGLKSQSELTAPPLFAHSIKKPSNGLLLREPGTIEVLSNDQRKLVFANAVLSDNATQTCIVNGGFSL
jgi:hypothetical protein